MRNAEVAGDLHLLAAVECECDQPVDVSRSEAGVVERALDRFAGESELAAAGLLGELGLTDTDDRGPILERGGHLPASRRGNVSTAVPLT